MYDHCSRFHLVGFELDDKAEAGDQPPAAAKPVDQPKRPVDAKNQQQRPSLDTTP